MPSARCRVRLRPFAVGAYTLPVPPDATIVVSDAHLGAVSDDVAAAFHRFLTTVPDLADHLIINGDLFEFWFEYRDVIPRAAFPTLAALAALRRAGVRLTLTGGNHDRWGGAFWRDQLDAAFHPDGVELEVAGLRALVAHGDGVAEPDPGSRILRAVSRHRLVRAMFGALHPDAGYALVRRLGPVLARRAQDGAELARVAAAQAAAARHLLAARADLVLVVYGHTHCAALEAVGTGRWYLNPGAWMDGYRYARITSEGPALAQWEG